MPDSFRLPDYLTPGDPAYQIRVKRLQIEAYRKDISEAEMIIKVLEEEIAQIQSDNGQFGAGA